MATHPPRIRRIQPPSPEERARLAAEAEVWRAEHARRLAERRPAQLAALDTGPALPDMSRAADPWGLPAQRFTVDIAEGDEDDLTGPDGGFDPAQALTVAVSAVRSFLARRTCAHEQPRDDRHLFCSLCGIPLGEAHLWRV